MQLLGNSLEAILHKLPTKKMTLKTVAMLSIQMIKILKIIHEKNYIHRDIKPDNFTMGINDSNNKLFIIDFGLSKLYRDPKTLIHNPLIKRRKLTGTARYASINALEGYELSRRDDLESVSYVILYLLKGWLPWQGLIVKKKNDKYSKILEKKKELSDETLCKGFPYQIKQFVSYVRHLNYEEDPQYDFMIDLFLKILDDLNEKFDRIYDWNLNKSCIFGKRNKFGKLLSVVQPKKISNSPYANRIKNSSNNLFNNSNFVTRLNESITNFVNFSSLKGLFMTNNNMEDNFDKSSQISEDNSKGKNNQNMNENENRNISELIKQKTSIHLYKANIDKKKNICMSQCCSIM